MGRITILAMSGFLTIFLPDVSVKDNDQGLFSSASKKDLGQAAKDLKKLIKRVEKGGKYDVIKEGNAARIISSGKKLEQIIKNLKDLVKKAQKNKEGAEEEKNTEKEKEFLVGLEKDMIGIKENLVSIIIHLQKMQQLFEEEIARNNRQPVKVPIKGTLTVEYQLGELNEGLTNINDRLKQTHAQLAELDKAAKKEGS